MAQDTVRNIVILGSGPAGLTAAIYAARAGLSPLVIDGMQRGGQLTQTSEVENFPGFPEPIKGMELMERMRAQAEACGVEFALDEVTSVDFSGEEKILYTMMGVEIKSKAVIVATGATARWTNLPGESVYKSKGVASCATCDGAFFRGKDVAVIGGGESAVVDALYLSTLASSVTVVHRRDTFRAAHVSVMRLLEKENVKVEWNSTVEEFVGDGKRLSGVRIKNKQTGEEKVISVAGAFVAIGHTPVTSFLNGSIELDDAGYIVTDNTATSIEGVYAAGDAAEPIFKQAIVASGRGAIAAIRAAEYLANKK
jgi:thioredoxin reductase (NADPH)